MYPDRQSNDPMRLDEISTITSMFDGKGMALVLRYGPAIKRFLTGWLRNSGWPNAQELADDISQDLTVKLLERPFSNNPAKRGRFRDYLKRAVINHAYDALRQRVHDKKTIELDPEWLQSPDAEKGWRDEYRRVFLDRVATLAAEVASGFPHLILRLLAENNEDEAYRRAQGEATHRPAPSQDALRQQIRRVRLKIAPILIDEIRDGLDDPTDESVQAELAELGLWNKYTKQALYGGEQP